MLNVFPNLLTYSFFAPTLLRVALALLFIYVAYVQYSKRAHLGQFAWISIILHAALAVMLFVGYYTQVAALAGGLGSLVGLFRIRGTEHFIVYSKSTLLLIVTICLSLLLTGAGAFAFDLPL